MNPYSSLENCMRCYFLATLLEPKWDFPAEVKEAWGKMLGEQKNIYDSSGKYSLSGQTLTHMIGEMVYFFFLICNCILTRDYQKYSMI